MNVPFQVSALTVEKANYEQELAEKQALIDQLEGEKEKNKGAEESLFRELEEQKQKNNVSGWTCGGLIY